VRADVRGGPGGRAAILLAAPASARPRRAALRARAVVLASGRGGG
jgi:hypothetical protein